MKLEDPAWLVKTLSKRVVYTIPGMSQTRVYKNLVYKRSTEKELTADIYVPPNRLEYDRHPGVVFIHGGYLPPNLKTQPKDWGVFKSYGELIAASGLVGITFNHRYYGQDHLDTAQKDIQDLVYFVRDHAEQYQLDKDRLVFWSFSGGGPLISWTLQTVPSYLCALVLYYTLLDKHIRPENKTAQITVEKMMTFSPVVQLQNIDQEIFPIFIARAGLDRPALNATIDHFVQIALSKNVKLDLSNHAQGQHGFDTLDDDERSRQIIRQTIEFIRLNSQE